jgi:hypothetical protein
MTWPKSSRRCKETNYHREQVGWAEIDFYKHVPMSFMRLFAPPSVMQSRSDASPREAHARFSLTGSFINESPRAHARAASPGDSSLRLGMTGLGGAARVIETRGKMPLAS